MRFLGLAGSWCFVLWLVLIWLVVVVMLQLSVRLGLVVCAYYDDSACDLCGGLCLCVCRLLLVGLVDLRVGWFLLGVLVLHVACVGGLL